MKKILYIAIIALSSFLSLGAQNVDGFLRTSGTQIVTESGTEFIIRGMGPGGWMLQEGYMFHTPVGTQWEIREMLEDLTDKATTDAFYDDWLTHFFTRTDVELIADWGFNSIRVPLHYNLFTLPIEEEPVLGEITWLDKGFTMVDDLLTWCEDNDIYLILDLHGAPGGQGRNADISDYDPSKPSLWESGYNTDKAVAIWRKLAERYKDKVYIGGYDLLNETNWGFEGEGGTDNGCGCNANAPLLDLYHRMIDTIRVVDTNHLIFIEGNCWANDFNGLEPLAEYDNNLAFSFHKYWTYNTDAVIQGLLDMRSRTNVPLYLGETGENSNTWMTDMVKQMERLGIGWSTWAYKQIDCDDPFTIISDKWKAITDYNPTTGANRPSKAVATEAMADMIEKLKTPNCKFNPDVVYALTGSPLGAPTKAYKDHSIPGTIFATDYDMGEVRKGWYDKVYQNFHVSSGEYTAWNNGYQYRNDGVDIEPCTDDITNGYNVAHTDNGEWLKYTLKDVIPGNYKITFRVAAYSGKINLRIGNQMISQEHIVTPHTGGYQLWKDVLVENVNIPEGTTEMTLVIAEGGLNLNYIKFEAIPTSVQDIAQEEIYISNIHSKSGHLNIQITNKTESPLSISSIDIFNMQGRLVVQNKMAQQISGIGEISITAPPQKGLYIIRLNTPHRPLTKSFLL
ncbi:carbohydrate-binding protein [Labilibacter sediminis]|nr:carbohydrate-binding protein [Labilibacter sediminis]